MKKTELLIEAARLRDSQTKIIATLLFNAHKRHIFALEADIQLYRRDLLQVFHDIEQHVSISKNDTGYLALALNNLTSDMQRVGEKYLEHAALLGFRRALSDLRLRGWIKDFVEPKKAPEGVAEQVIAENKTYLKTSLMPDLHAKLHGSADPVAVLKSFEYRVGMYAHYLWRAAERAYVLGVKSYFSSVPQKKKTREGGPGSGNFGHLGRPGQVGGSTSTGAVGPHSLPPEVQDALFARGMDPATFHDHAVQMMNILDEQHKDDPTWSRNVEAVKNAMANYPMIHATALENIPRIVAQGLAPASEVGKGLEFDKETGLNRAVYMRQGQAGGGGHGAVGVMVDQTQLDPNRFLVTKLGLMTLKAEEEPLLHTPGDHTALLDKQLQPFRESTIPISDLPDVQARLLVAGYEKDHINERGSLHDPARVVENDHGVMEVKYIGHIPPSAVKSYFAGDEPLSAGGKSAYDSLIGVVPNEKLVRYHGEGLHDLSRAYRQHYATAIREAMREGGSGSGDHGHAGRPGKRGGSAPGVSVKPQSHIIRVLEPGEYVQLESGISASGTPAIGDKRASRRFTENDLAIIKDEIQNVEQFGGQRFHEEVLIAPKVLYTDALGNERVIDSFAALTISNKNQLVINPHLAGYEPMDNSLTERYDVADMFAKGHEGMLRMVVDHEYGHIVSHARNPYATPYEFRKEREAALAGLKGQIPISRYADSSEGEDFAESYSAYVNNHKDELPKYARDYFDKTIGRPLHESDIHGDKRVALRACDFRNGRTLIIYDDGTTQTTEVGKVRVV